MFLVNSWKEYIQIQQRHTIKTSIIATHAHAYIRVEACKNTRDISSLQLYAYYNCEIFYEQ